MIIINDKNNYRYPSSSKVTATTSTKRNMRRRENHLLFLSSSSSHQQQHPSSSLVASNYYLATCIPGLATVLQKELIQLQCKNVQIQSSAAVTFEMNHNDMKTILNVLLWTRTAHKIMELLCSTSTSASRNRIYNRQELYKFISNNIDVKDLFGNGTGGLLSTSVHITYNNNKYIPADINHSHYTALTIKNACIDMIRNLRTDRPNIDLIDPDVPIHAIIFGVPKNAYHFNNNNNVPNYNNGRQQQQLQERQQQQQQQQRNKNDDDNSDGAIVSVYRQIHTGSLHRRGYRGGGENNIAIHKAAMKESLAAGLLLHSGWDTVCSNIINKKKNEKDDSNDDHDEAILIDPMTGSGSFLLEGAMIAADIAPGLMRIKCNVMGSTKPPILRWKNDDTSSDEMNEIWKSIVLNATNRAKIGIQKIQNNQNKIRIVGNDIHEGALELAERALKFSGLHSIVDLSPKASNCKDWIPFVIKHGNSNNDKNYLSNSVDNDEQNNNNVDDYPTWNKNVASCMVVCNPPWGIRLNDDNTNIHDAWESLRIFLRETCPPSTQAWILCGNKELTKHLGMQRSQSIPIKTGEQDLRFLQYIIREKNSNSTTINQRQHEQHPLTMVGNEKGERKYNNERGTLQVKEFVPNYGGKYKYDSSSSSEFVSDRRVRLGQNRQGRRLFTNDKYERNDSSPRPRYTNGMLKPSQRSSTSNDKQRKRKQDSDKTKTVTSKSTEKNDWLI